jgi:hypothetical protein
MATMISFKELNEAFDKPLEYDVDLWHKQDSLMYSFKLDDNDYYRVVIFKSKNITRDGAHEISFEHLKNEKDVYSQRSGKMGLLNKFTTAQSIKVFSTVIAIIKEHLSDRPDIKQIVFYATGREQSRVKLYEKLSIMAAKKLKWNAYLIPMADDDERSDTYGFLISKGKIKAYQDRQIKF